MIDERTTEREDLEELVACPGFARFCAHLRKEWSGDGYKARMAAAREPATMWIIHQQSQAVLDCIHYPERRIEQLRGERQ